MPKSSTSESDDDRTLQASDEDVLQEEEDRERLLETPKSGIRKIFKSLGSDPNQPLKTRLTRKDMKREKRKQRRARQRRKKDEDEDSLLYEMDDQDKGSDDYSNSPSSLERFVEKKSYRRKPPRRLALLIITPIVLLLILGLLFFGAYSMTRARKEAKIKSKLLRSNGTSNFAPTTILISLDGFRADFLDRGLTPTLNSFVAEGVSPKYMLPSFPSLTFPNHWTLVTGLYPESHGIVGNTFWDPDLEEQFQYTDPRKSMFPKWWASTGAEALWSNCESQGVKTAIHMWPGSEAGMLLEPITVDKYNGSETLSRKVDRVLGFLDRPSEYDDGVGITADARPEFIAMYVPNVDTDGHKYGPNSTEIRTTIGKVDTMMADLLSGLKQRNLTDIVNLIVVSDHGMATTSNDRVIQFEDLADPATIEHVDGWPLYGLRPKSEVDVNALYERLRVKAAENGHFEVYLRGNMPQRWHFSNSHRIAPLWIIPEAGYAIAHRSDFNVQAAKTDGSIYEPRGLHGYDHEHPLMRAIFIARGPSFPHQANSEIPVFQNVEVYNIVCDSLGVEPKPNNGTLRLPLKTVGLHTNRPEVPTDLPTSTTSALETSTTSSLATAELSVSISTTTLISPTASEAPKQDDVGKEDQHVSTWWEAVMDKMKAAKAWLSKVFGANTKDAGQPDETTTSA